MDVFHGVGEHYGPPTREATLLGFFPEMVWAVSQSKGMYLVHRLEIDVAK